MKHIFFARALALMVLLSLLLSGPMVCAQAPNWQTAVGINITPASGAIVNVQSMVPEASGNVYLAGQFRGTVSFGAITLASISTSTISFDVFVAKWNPTTGAFLWVQRAAGVTSEYSTGMAVSGSSIYVVGGFNAATLQLGSTTLTNAGDSDLYVTKLTDAGTSAAFVWAQRGGGVGDDGGRTIALNGSSIYVAGDYGSGSGTFGTTTLANSDPSGATVDAFVAKLTDAGPTGSVTWAKAGGGALSDEITVAVAVSGSNVYVTGQFLNASTTFGSTVLTNANTNGSGDVYVAKLADAGAGASFAWAQRAGGTGNDSPVGSTLVATPSGVYTEGIFGSATADFGATVLTNAGTGAAPGNDVYVAKLTDAGSTGSFAWAQRAGGTGSDIPRGLAVSGSNVYVAGGYGSATASFGSTVLTNAGAFDVFMAKLTDVGAGTAFTWAQRAGGAGNDDTFVTAIRGTSIFVMGRVSPPASFGSLTIATPVGTLLPFLASLTDPTLTAAAEALPTPAIALYPNPANRTTTVRLPAVPGATAATLTLRDALGRAVRTQQVSLNTAGATAEIPLGGLAPGLYQVQVQAGGQQASRALAVE